VHGHGGHGERVVGIEAPLSEDPSDQVAAPVELGGISSMVPRSAATALRLPERKTCGVGRMNPVSVLAGLAVFLLMCRARRLFLHPAGLGLHMPEVRVLCISSSSQKPTY